MNTTDTTDTTDTTEIHGYLIDPFAETVTKVAYEGDFTCIYKHIKASLFTTVWLESRKDSMSVEKNFLDTDYHLSLSSPSVIDAIFVDDEGLFKDDQRFFMLRGYHEPLAGRGLVLGANAEGDTTSPKITMEKLTELISFGDVWDLMKKAG